MNWLGGLKHRKKQTVDEKTKFQQDFFARQESEESKQQHKKRRAYSPQPINIQNPVDTKATINARLDKFEHQFTQILISLNGVQQQQKEILTKFQQLQGLMDKQQQENLDTLKKKQENIN